MVVYDYQGCPDEKSSVCPLMTLAMIMFNRREYVRPAVESLLRQDYPNLEIVISDDHSEDGALETVFEIVRRYRGPHRVVVNVNEKNLGLCGNFAAALSLAHGEWIVACGGDDVQHENRVGVIAEYAVRCPSAVIIGSGASTIDRRGNKIGEMGVTVPYLYKKYRGGDFRLGAPNTADASALFSVAAGACAAYRRDIVQVLPFPSDAAFEDLVMDFRGIQLGDILLVPDRLLDYRIHPASVCSGGGKATGRCERRNFRRRISDGSYVSWKSVLSEAKTLRATDDRCFFSVLEIEIAKFLLWSFHEKTVFRRNRDLYVSAYRTARERYSFLRLLRGAEGRGLMMPFLAVVVLSFMSRSGRSHFGLRLDGLGKEGGMKHG